MLQRHIEDNKVDFVVQFKPEHIIYKAHFPNNPITPGVCIVQIAKELFSFLTEKNYTITKLKSVKFLNPILPNDMVVFYFDWEYIDDLYHIKVHVFDVDVSFAKINMQLKQNE